MIDFTTKFMKQKKITNETNGTMVTITGCKYLPLCGNFAAVYLPAPLHGSG